MLLTDLKKELPFKWRVQSVNDYAAVCVAYIDSRDVQDLLDEVCKQEGWQSDYKEVKGNLYAGIGIKFGDEWIWKWDCGVESKTEAEKGEASDSFKRAAVKWGVGRFLYNLDIKRLKVTEYKNKKYPLNEKTGKAIFDGEELSNYINSLSKSAVNPLQSWITILDKCKSRADVAAVYTANKEAIDSNENLKNLLKEYQGKFPEVKKKEAVAA